MVLRTAEPTKRYPWLGLQVLDEHVWREWKERRDRDTGFDVGTKSGRYVRTTPPKFSYHGTGAAVFIDIGDDFSAVRASTSRRGPVTLC